jgi:hypothetical protein
MNRTRIRCNRPRQNAFLQGQILSFWNNTCLDNDSQHCGEESFLLLEEAVSHRPIVSNSSDRPVQFIDDIQVGLPHSNDAQKTHTWTSLNGVTECTVVYSRNKCPSDGIALKYVRCKFSSVNIFEGVDNSLLYVKIAR